MGFVLSVVYFITYYLTPKVLFGPLADYRVQLILAVLAILVSIPKLRASIPLKTPQSLALIGLAIAVLLSVVIGVRWIGGGVQAFLSFIPNAFGYFLVCLHCNSKRRLQILAAMLGGVCLFVMANGAWDLRRGVPEGGPPISAETGSVNTPLWTADHPYLLPMQNDAGQWFYRVRGQGNINDPNDFGQLIVCTIPLMFLFWRPKKKLLNLACVLLPVCILLVGIYLTHSRGALIALAVLALAAARTRIGTIPALVLAVGVLAGSMALQFTGGRDISVTAGADRMALWGGSLQLFKTHPLFGVGFGELSEYLGETAHNSVAVCAAELGLFGLFFWSLFLFPTVRDALVVASPKNVGEGKPMDSVPEPVPGPVKSIKVFDKSEIIHLGWLVFLSLVAFLTAGFFLSRAFVMTLFLLGGMTEVVYGLALDQAMIPPRMGLRRVTLYSAVLAASCVVVLYIVIRVMNLVK
jgi:hypothetical protein